MQHFDSIKPAAIVKCSSVEDIRNSLAFVRNNKLAVTPRCGGHSWAGTSTTTGVVLNVTNMNAIQVNADGSAKIGAGARLAEVYDTLIGHGVCIPSGTCLTVGIAGITLGGGIGILDRQYGLTCDNLLAAEVLTADGRLLSCDASHEPDLFWALRSGGGVFAVGLLPRPGQRRAAILERLPRRHRADQRRPRPAVIPRRRLGHVRRLHPQRVQPEPGGEDSAGGRPFGLLHLRPHGRRLRQLPRPAAQRLAGGVLRRQLCTAGAGEKTI
nr:MULTISPECIES: FAD-dependent oxidoreductase [unclassified Duganella]